MTILGLDENPEELYYSYWETYRMSCCCIVWVIIINRQNLYIEPNTINGKPVFTRQRYDICRFDGETFQTC